MMRTNFTWDVFLSWTINDKLLMQRVKDELSSLTYTDADKVERKLKVYSSDVECVGSFVENLDENINDSAIVIPIVTDNFNKNQNGWCVNELVRAHANQKDPEFKQGIIPLLFVPSEGTYKFILDPISSVNKVSSPSDGDGFDEAIEQLKLKVYKMLKNRELKNAAHLNIYDSVYSIVSDIELYHKTAKPLGRDKDLKDFEQFVAQNDISILTSGLGLGKTKFVKYFLFEQAAKGVDVKIIKAYNKSFSEGLLDIVFEQETPPADQSFQQKISWIKNRLQKVEKKTIIVFDGLNCDGIANALQMDFGKNVKLILTSNGYDGKGKIFKLPLLSEDILCDMFYDIYKEEKREDTEKSVRKIIEMVQSHTMALTIIASMLQASKKLLTVDKILEKIGKGELLAMKQRCFVQNDDYNGVSATIREILQQLFDMSLITDKDKSKEDLLRFLFFVSGDGISLEELKKYIKLEDTVVIDELYSAGWLKKSESGAVGLHIIVKWLVKCNLFGDAIPADTEAAINNYFNDCIEHNPFDSRFESLQKINANKCMAEGINQFDNPVFKARLCRNLSKLNDILGNYDLALNNIDEAEAIYSRILPEQYEDYLDCKNFRLLLYSMRLWRHPDINKIVSAYLGVNESKFTKEQLFTALSESIIKLCKKYKLSKGEVIGFCYRVCADQLMQANGDKMKDKSIEKLLTLSYKAREAVKSFFWFETMDTFGKYYLKLATEKYVKDEKKKNECFLKAERYYNQAYGYKQAIGRENGVKDDYNPFIGTSNAFLGILYAKKGDYLASYNFHKKGIEIRINMYGETHPYVIKCYDEIFKIYDKALSAIADGAQKLNLACLCFDYVVRCITAKNKAGFLESADMPYYIQIAERAYGDIHTILSAGATCDKHRLQLIEQQYTEVILPIREIKKAC